MSWWCVVVPLPFNLQNRVHGVLLAVRPDTLAVFTLFSSWEGNSTGSRFEQIFFLSKAAMEMTGEQGWASCPLPVPMLRLLVLRIWDCTRRPCYQTQNVHQINTQKNVKQIIRRATLRLVAPHTYKKKLKIWCHMKYEKEKNILEKTNSFSKESSKRYLSPFFFQIPVHILCFTIPTKIWPWSISAAVRRKAEVLQSQQSSSATQHQGQAKPWKVRSSSMGRAPFCPCMEKSARRTLRPCNSASFKPCPSCTLHHAQVLYPMSERILFPCATSTHGLLLCILYWWCTVLYRSSKPLSTHGLLLHMFVFPC